MVCGSSSALTRHVVLGGRLPVETVEVGVSVSLRGVDPVADRQSLHGGAPGGQPGRRRRRRVILGAHPGEGARAGVRGVPAVARDRGHAGAVAVIHGAHQDLAAAVLGQLSRVRRPPSARTATAAAREVGGAEDRARMVIGRGGGGVVDAGRGGQRGRRRGLIGRLALAGGGSA